jgi:exopolyphosphatase / guanosine-5'-triphosphate,3'-diphosphate pyrophosphatase
MQRKPLMNAEVMSSGPVAVIDIGSNSIKVLVARREPDGDITALKVQSLDARISAGISRSAPSLTEAGMSAGVEAIRRLLAATVEFKPVETILVGTSAVRDASNGREFCERVRATTGHTVSVLTGDEEAKFIGEGLAVDPALRDLRDYYVFDLGGGSLECLAFRDRTLVQTASLPLGCVRLMEKFVVDPKVPFSAASAQQVKSHTRDVLAQSTFEFALPRDAVVVGTGGTITTVRAIFAAREAKSLDETDSRVTLSDLRKLLEVLAEMPLERRKQISGLPRARADVFPVALATLIAVAELGGFPAYHHSTYNLRYGIAADRLR